MSFVIGFHEASLSAFAAKSHLPDHVLHIIVKTSIRLKERGEVWEGGGLVRPIVNIVLLFASLHLLVSGI